MKKQSDIQQSIRNFVQQFYDWYAPLAVKRHHGPAWNFALADRNYVFSPELFHALHEDSEASKKAKGEIVGLDFDPFLNSQDPCDRYQVGKVTHKGELFLVEIFGMCSGKENTKPDTVAEVARRNGHWVFTNFYYPESPSGDLLKTLRLLARDRERPAQ